MARPDTVIDREYELDGFHNYRSPFTVTALVSGPHGKWSYHRDEYARSGHVFDYNMMLNQVTIDNPPMAGDRCPDLAERSSWEEWKPIVINLIAFLGGLIVMAIASGVF